MYRRIKNPWIGKEGYNYEAQSVVDCLEIGLTECPTMPLSATAQMMQLMDEMRERIGLKYPFEKQ